MVRTVDPATEFVKNPYVLGSSRSTVFRLEHEDANGQVRPLDLVAGSDRVEVHVARNFSDASDAEVLRFSSAGDAPAITKTGAAAPNEFTWLIPFSCSVPAGALQYRCWRIANPGTATEFREPLWTETFLAVR